MLDQKKRTLKRLGIAGVATAMTTMGIPGIAGAATVRVAPDATTVTASAPAAPTGLTATDVGAGQVMLKWTAPSGTVDGYNVYFSTTSGGEASATAANKDVLISGTSYTVSVPNSGTFYFQVAAVNAFGQGALSTEVSATATAVAPGVPGSVTATAADAAVAISWTAASGSPTGYTVNYGLASNALTNQVKVSGSSTTAVVSGLTNGTAYYFDVVATNAAGAGTASAVVTATPNTNTAPLPPTNVTATGGNGEITLSWTGSANATGYDVYAGTKPGGESTTPVNGTVLISGTTTTVTVANGTTEYFVVKAVNSSGMSAASNEVSATATSATPVQTSAAPSAPQGFKATPIGSGAVKLTWSAPSYSGSSGVVEYYVARKLSSATAYGSDSKTSTTSDIITNLTPGDTYDFEVQAVNAASANNTKDTWPYAGAEATASAATTSKTPTVPQSPTLVSLKTVYTGAVTSSVPESNTISWKAASYPISTGHQIKDFQIVRNGVVIGSVSAGKTSFTDSGKATSGLSTDTAPVAGTTYSYKVTEVTSTSGTATSGSSKIDTGSAVPGAPTGLSATETATAGTVSLSWTAPIDQGAGNLTYAVLENGAAAPTADVTLKGTTATVKGVSSTTATSFTVEAESQNAAGTQVLGTSAQSVAASVVAKAASKSAAAPTGLTAAGTTPSTIKLQWNASSTDGFASPTNYVVYGSTSSKSLVSTANELAKIDTSTSFTATGLSSGTKYYFEVEASPLATTPTGSNVASASTTTTSTVSPQVPGAPTSLKATDDGALVDLTWTAPKDTGAGITGYEIFSTTTDSPKGAVVLGSTSGTGTTAYIDNQTAGTPIYLWAEAMSSVGNSALSAPVEITPSSSAARPSAPSTPVVTPFAGGAEVVWTPPLSVGTSPIIGYFVTAHLVNGKGKTVRIDNGSATSAKITGLAAGSYYFTVVAINAVGGGAPSAPSSFVSVPAIPTKVFVTPPKAIVGPGNVTIRVTVNQPSAKVQLFDEPYKGTFFSKAIMMTTPAKYGNGVAEFTVHVAATNHFYVMVNGVKSNVVAAMVSD